MSCTPHVGDPASAVDFDESSDGDHLRFDGAHHLVGMAVDHSLQDCLDVCTLADMRALRMPVATASRKGVSKLAAEAEAHRVILTSHGRPVAIVDSAERVDEDLRRIREASRSVVEAAGELTLGRSNRFTLEDVCAKLNIDPQRVRTRAAVKRG